MHLLWVSVKGALLAALLPHSRALLSRPRCGRVRKAGELADDLLAAGLVVPADLADPVGGLLADSRPAARPCHFERVQ